MSEISINGNEEQSNKINPLGISLISFLMNLSLQPPLSLNLPYRSPPYLTALILFSLGSRTSNSMSCFNVFRFAKGMYSASEILLGYI